MPHATEKRPVTLYQEGKKAAGFGPGLVNRADISIEKNAAVPGALENESLIGGFIRVIAKELRRFQAEKTGQPLHIALVQLGGCHTAAVPARGAVGFLFNLFGNRLQPPLDKVVAFQPCAKPQVFVPLLFADPLDLHEVGEHSLQYRNKTGPVDLVRKGAAR